MDLLCAIYHHKNLIAVAYHINYKGQGYWCGEWQFVLVQTVFLAQGSDEFCFDTTLGTQRIHGYGGLKGCGRTFTARQGRSRLIGCARTGAGGINGV